VIRAQKLLDDAFATAFAAGAPGDQFQSLMTDWNRKLRLHNLTREKALGAVLYEQKGALEFNYLNPASTPNVFTFRFSYTNPLGGRQHISVNAA